MSAVKSARGPLLVRGDFNGRRGRAVPECSRGNRGDRILMSVGVSAEAIWNPGTTASTHLPVVADVVVPGR